MTDQFTSVMKEISDEDYKGATVVVNVPGQPAKEYKAPVIISAIDNNVVSGSFIGTNPKDILLAINSMINTYRSISNDLIFLGDLLSLALEDVIGEIQGGVC